MLVASFVKLPSKWHNELGSTMTVTSLNLSKGRFEGGGGGVLSINSFAIIKQKDLYDLIGKFFSKKVHD